MKKIKVDEWGCCDSECKFWKKCVQHSSAGDFRSEYAPVPNIFIETDDDSFWCDSHDNLSDDFCGEFQPIRK